AGLLLFFRRTATLGALLTFGVMAHVTLMNLCFDVPVKLYSAHLTLLSLFAAAPDLPRLASVLWFHRPTDAVNLHPYQMGAPSDPPGKTSGLGQKRSKLSVGVKVLVVCLSIVVPQASCFTLWASLQAKSELHGLYRVDRFSRDGQEIPLLASDPTL